MYAAAGVLLAALWCFTAQAGEAKLPADFVYLRGVAPTIVQDMRYATPNNFTGEPVPGYDAAECILKRRAAEALKSAQENAQKQGYSLKVYDCYRPIRAVQAFMAWAAARDDGRTKRYYPRLSKPQLVPGYIADRSGHSAGWRSILRLSPSPQARSARAANCPEIAPRLRKSANRTPASTWARRSIASTQGEYRFAADYAGTAQSPHAFENHHGSGRLQELRRGMVALLLWRSKTWKTLRFSNRTPAALRKPPVGGSYRCSGS